MINIQFLCCMCSYLDTMPLKLLSIPTENGEIDPHVIGRNEKFFSGDESLVDEEGTVDDVIIFLF